KGDSAVSSYIIVPYASTLHTYFVAGGKFQFQRSAQDNIFLPLRAIQVLIPSGVEVGTDKIKAGRFDKVEIGQGITFPDSLYNNPVPGKIHRNLFRTAVVNVIASISIVTTGEIHGIIPEKFNSIRLSNTFGILVFTGINFIQSRTFNNIKKVAPRFFSIFLYNNSQLPLTVERNLIIRRHYHFDFILLP